MGLPVDNQTVVYYQYKVLIDGQYVGTLQRFNPSTERDLERIREIGNPDEDTTEIAKGRSATQIVVERLELNKKALMQLLGSDDFVDIAEITESVDIVELITYPGGQKRQIEYLKCVPKSQTKTISVDTITVTESITFWVTKVKRGRLRAA